MFHQPKRKTDNHEISWKTVGKCFEFEFNKGSRCGTKAYT